MSSNPCFERGCPDAATLESIETLIVPHARDIGEFEPPRAPPSAKRQIVVPFNFFDQAGPPKLATGHGLDVRLHRNRNCRRRLSA
ncbi:MAG: hypothetical protein KGM42_15015 [Hyphomicrobiales bacterium]|nr:hypothetical protein [Hyphomicrobiales bacterium]